jgi:phospholipid transport system substrate-binding protein
MPEIARFGDPVARAGIRSGAVRGRRRFLIALALALGFFGTGIAGAPGPLNEPQKVVQRVSDGLRRVLREDRHLLQNDPRYVYRLVDELFMPNVDYQRVCATVLGPFWKKASAGQREAFGEEFKQLLIHTYATAVNELSEWEIRYLPLPLDRGDKDVLVRTQVLRPGGEAVDVNYRMYRKGGRWLAYDVAVAGVSLLTNYRSTFVRLARKKGIDGLIADLGARNATRARGS